MNSYEKSYREMARQLIAKIVAAARKECLDVYELGKRIYQGYPWDSRDFKAHQAWLKERSLALRAYERQTTVEVIDREEQARLKEQQQQRKRRDPNQKELL